MIRARIAAAVCAFCAAGLLLLPAVARQSAAQQAAAQQGAGAAKPQAESTPAAPAPQPFTLGSLADDRGQFEITVNGQKVGTEEFSVSKESAGWVAKGSTDIHSGASNAKVTGELHLNPGGIPLRYVWNADTGRKSSSTTTFEGLEAKMSTTVGSAEPIKQEFYFKPPVIILDDNLYHQYAILARLYNWTIRGAQNFNVLIPQEHMPGSVAVEALGPANGLEQLRVHTNDLNVILLVDSTHKLMRISVPSAKAEIVRK